MTTKPESIMKEQKEIPNFQSETEEREFWAKRDSTEFIDWTAAESVALPNLKPTMKTVSLRMPEFIIDELRMIARKRDISYQALIKVFIKERIDQEHRQRALPQ